MRLIAAILCAVLVIALMIVLHHSSHPKNLAAVTPPVAVTSSPTRVVERDGHMRRHARVRSGSRRAPSLDWDALAACESSGHWDDTAGYFQGGLQFAPSTWASFRGTDFAPRADLASRRQQIIVAERVLRRQGLAAWPACTRKLGWR